MDKLLYNCSVFLPIQQYKRAVSKEESLIKLVFFTRKQRKASQGTSCILQTATIYDEQHGKRAFMPLCE